MINFDNRVQSFLLNHLDSYIENYSIFNLDRSLNFSKISNVKVKLNNSNTSTYYTDESYIKDITMSVYNKTYRYILNDIKNEIYKSSYYDYLNFIDKRIGNTRGLNNPDIPDIVATFLSKQPFKNIIVSSMMGHLLMKSRKFSLKNTNIKDRNLILDFIGNINSINIYIDPSMVIMDDKILLLDDIFINIANPISSLLVDSTNLNTNLNTTFDYNFRLIGNYKFLYVFDSESSYSYKKYIKISRDIKLNDLLNEKE